MSICPPHAGTSGPVAYTATFSTRGDFALFSPQGQLARSGDIFGHHTLGDATLGHLTAYGTKGKYLLMFCFQQGNHGEELMRSFQQKWGQGSEGHVPAQGRTTQTFLRRRSGRLCLLIFVLSSVPQGKSPRIRKNYMTESCGSSLSGLCAQSIPKPGLRLGDSRRVTLQDHQWPRTPEEVSAETVSAS